MGGQGDKKQQFFHLIKLWRQGLLLVFFIIILVFLKCIKDPPPQKKKKSGAGSSLKTKGAAKEIKMSSIFIQCSSN